jgi:hypothetical protein
MYKLYWIKYPEHNDPFIDGYIGITSQDIEKRFNNHKYNTKNKHLKNRCNQKDVEIVCLFDDLERQEACLLEEEYRPKENIGWNINKGGDLPPSQKGKAHKSWSLKGDDRTEKQKEGSKKRSEKIKGNNFSGQRKNKVDYTKACDNCGLLFNPGYERRRKYCCIKCATETRNKNPEYIKKLSEKTKQQWKMKKVI